MARHARHDRQKVLEKALALFWAKGYHATSLKDLEAALDMRPGSIYGTFGSKEGLFSEALRLYADTSKATFLEMIEQGATPLGALADHVRSLGCPEARQAPSRACMLVKTLLETPDDDPGLRAETEALMRGMEAAFAKVYRDAQRIGELPAGADPDRLASRLQAEIFGLRAYAQRTDSQARVAQLAEDIAGDIRALAAR